MSDNQPPPYPGPEGYPPPPPGYPPSPYGYGAYPTPPPGYPPPPYGYGGYPPPYAYGVPSYSLGDALGWGWRKFSQNAGMVFLGSLIYVVITALCEYIGATVSGQGFWEFDSLAGSLEPRWIAGSLISWFASFWVGAAWVRASLDVADGKRFDYLSALRRVPLVKVVLASLIAWVLVLLGVVALVMGSIVMLLLTYLTMYALLDESLGAWGAVKRSIRVTWKNFGEALLLAFVSCLLLLAGLLALVVGVLVAGPVTAFAATYAWRLWSGRTVAA